MSSQLRSCQAAASCACHSNLTSSAPIRRGAGCAPWHSEAMCESRRSLTRKSQVRGDDAGGCLPLSLSNHLSLHDLCLDREGLLKSADDNKCQARVVVMVVVVMAATGWTQQTTIWRTKAGVHDMVRSALTVELHHDKTVV